MTMTMLIIVALLVVLLIIVIIYNTNTRENYSYGFSSGQKCSNNFDCPSYFECCRRGICAQGKRATFQCK